VVAKVRERLAVIREVTQNFNGERFNLKKLNELKVRKQYLIETTNRLAALENLIDGEEINTAWRTLKRKQNKNIYIINSSTVSFKNRL